MKVHANYAPRDDTTFSYYQFRRFLWLENDSIYEINKHIQKFYFLFDEKRCAHQRLFVLE